MKQKVIVPGFWVPWQTHNFVSPFATLCFAFKLRACLVIKNLHISQPIKKMCLILWKQSSTFLSEYCSSEISLLQTTFLFCFLWWLPLMTYDSSWNARWLMKQNKHWTVHFTIAQVTTFSTDEAWNLLRIMSIKFQYSNINDRNLGNIVEK